MPQRILKPIYDRITYSGPVSEALAQALYEVIYEPIFKILNIKPAARVSAKVRNEPFKALLPCPYNRALNKEKVLAIKLMIKLTGEIRPFVVVEVLTDQGKKMMITDGHHRSIAIQELIKEGWFDKDVEVPVVISGEAGVDSAKDTARVRINSMQDIKSALRAGRIIWQDGYFYGEFNSVVGRALRDLGAKFIRDKRAYKLAAEKLPMDLRADIVIGKGMNQTKTEAIMRALGEASQMKLRIGGSDAAVSIMAGLNDQAVQTLKVLPENLQIPMDLPAGQKKELIATYHKNLEGYLEDLKQEQIERLKEKTQANAALGYRSDRLAKIVQTELGVSKTRATFIARQETAMLVSKFREERYKSAGVRQYIWSTSKDQRVRPDHKDLNGQVFDWDNPPIVDKAHGRRGHPGTDFGCRCIALPVVRLGAI